MAVTLAALSGLTFCGVLAVGVGAIAILATWVACDYSILRSRPGLPLAWIAFVLAGLFAVSGLADPIGGPLERWYANLEFAFVRTTAVDQFVLGLSAGLFLLATVNRIVRLVLDAAVTSWKKSETALTGGRLLGPMERLVVGAIVLAGDPAAAAIVIAAKGLLRFPEIRSDPPQPLGEPDDHGSGERRYSGVDEVPSQGPDARTEYFLVGTFTSLLMAAVLAVVVSAAG